MQEKVYNMKRKFLDSYFHQLPTLTDTNCSQHLLLERNHPHRHSAHTPTTTITVLKTTTTTTATDILYLIVAEQDGYEDVLGARQGHDRHGRGPQQQHEHPGEQESGEGTDAAQEVRVLGTALRDHGAKLRQRQRSFWVRRCLRG